MASRILNIITGASSELGSKLENYIKMDNNVIIYNRNPNKYKSQYLIRCDLTKSNEFYKLGDRLSKICKESKPEQINIIHMAGIIFCQELSDQFNEQEWISMFNVNCLAFYYIAKTVYNIINDLDSFITGSFIAISSNLTERVNHNNAGYIATKAALESVIKQLAYDMGNKNIRCNGIAPGFFQSRMSNNVSESMRKMIIQNTPLHRIGNSNDICRIIKFLLRKESSWINGHIITADGGNTIGY